MKLRLELEQNPCGYLPKKNGCKRLTKVTVITPIGDVYRSFTPRVLERSERA